MILLIFIAVLGLHFAYVTGNFYAAWRFSKIPNLWAFGATVAFLFNATQTLHGFVSLAFSFRPAGNPLWVNINTIIGLLERTGGIVLLCLLLHNAIPIERLKRIQWLKPYLESEFKQDELKSK